MSNKYTANSFSLKQLQRLEAKEYIGADCHLFVKKDKVITDWPLHWHDYFEIEIIPNSSGQYQLNETTYDLCEYNAFFLTPADFHQLSIKSPIKVINISFDETMLSSKYLSAVTNSKMKNAYHLSIDEQERLLMAVNLLQHECTTAGNCQSQIFEYILELLLKNGACSFLTTSKAERLSGIQKAILYMEMHFREKISLSLLAQQAGLNPNYFSELFQKVTGESYVEKLNHLRINYACTLLRNGFSASDACFSSGFGSLSHFLSVFKTRQGISPSEYKKLNNSK